MSKRDIKFAQHYVECTQCEGNAEYYCTTCTDSLCQVCRDRHTKSKATKSHSIVPYHERQTTLQESESCSVHPELSYDMACRECQLPVCIRCMKEDHRGHTFKNIDEVLQELDALCNDKVKKIKKILPKWRDRLSQLSDRRTKSEESVIEIKKKLQEDTKKIKDSADAILEEKMKEVKADELLLHNEYDSMTNATENTVSKYENLLTEYENDRKSYEKLRLQKEILQTDVSEPAAFQIPEDPSYQNVKIKRKEIVKLFEKLSITKKALGTSPANICQEFEFELPFDSSTHICYVPSEKFWIGNNEGQIILTDKTGKQLDEMKTTVNYLFGFYAVTESGELLYIDLYLPNKCIKKYTSGRKTITVINTGDWSPRSVYSSHKNNDILVGMKNYKLSHDPSRVVRYNKNGRELWQSQYDDKGRPLYQFPKYITENMNSDTCISDSEAVVVVDEEGKHRFSYRGFKEGSGFNPIGICTDIQGRILVIVIDDNVRVHMTDQDGKFITFLLTEHHGISNAYGLCKDKDNNLWICCGRTVKMYKTHLY